MHLLKRQLLRFCFAALVLGILAASLDIRTFSGRLARIQPAVLGQSLALVTLAVVVAAAKFKLVMPGLGFWPVFRTTALMQFYNLIIPGQVGGEVMRAVTLSETRQHAPAVAAATVFDRITGLIALLLLLLGALTLGPDRFGRPLTFAVVILALATLVATVALFKIDEKWLHIRVFGFGLPPWLLEFVERCARSLKIFMRHPGIVMASITLGLIHHLSVVGGFLVLGFGLGINLPVATWIVVMGLSSIVMLLPISIAGVGTRDLSFVALLGLAGVRPVSALALSFAVLGVQVLSGALSALLLFTPGLRARLPVDTQRPGAVVPGKPPLYDPSAL